MDTRYIVPRHCVNWTILSVFLFNEFSCGHARRQTNVLFLHPILSYFNFTYFHYLLLYSIITLSTALWDIERNGTTQLMQTTFFITSIDNTVNKFIVFAFSRINILLSNFLKNYKRNKTLLYTRNTLMK